MKQKAFTLLEILLVIAAIGILAAIVIVAINPQRQLALTRNAERQSSARSIEQSLEQFLIDEGGYPSSIDSEYQEICATDADDCTGLLDLSALVPDYIARIPEDPQSDDPNGTGFEVSINPFNNKISVNVPEAELEAPIAVNEYIQCPEGYIPVPGNSDYGTDDFCVMQFEAKNVGGLAVSQASGAPWSISSWVQNLVACSNVDAELMENSNWMTIARNIEEQGENWSGGSVGSGYLYRGFTPGTTGPGIEVADINNPYTGTNSSPDQRRTMRLSTGYDIWDFSGNMREVSSDWNPSPKPTGNGTTAVEWSSVTNFGQWGSDSFIGTNPSWNSTQNIGQFRQGATESVNVRGGSRADTTFAGIYAIDMSLQFTGYTNFTGFRCMIQSGVFVPPNK